MHTSIYLFALSILFSFNLAAQRNLQSLNSAWEFSLENQECPEIINIPHSWNTEDPFRDGKEYFRGKGTYQKSLFTPEAWGQKRVFLKFEGSNQITTLFVNDQKIGEHRGGYTGFVWDISDALNPGKENNLRIELDNAHNIDVPPLDADFNFYGGIYRDLELIISNPVHFEIANEATGNILVKTLEVSDESAKIQLETRLVNHSSENKNTLVSIEIFDPESNSVKTLCKKLRLRPSETKSLNFEYQIKDPELWSPDSPNLYSIQARISDQESGEVQDVFDTKVGFRWFEVDPEKGFFLNGNHIKLIGANRHQDFIGLGNALPNKLHKTDYKMIKDMGANFIRTAHYPQDPEVYKICDELGLLVWSEIPVINDVTDSESYHLVALQMQREQISQFFNHPSVVFWGYMNEIFIRLVFNNTITEAEKEAKIKTSVALAEKLEMQTKKLDPDRLSVMALHENELYNTSGIADIPDVIGWNLYFGWYSQGLENFGKFLDNQHKRYPNRPLIISEYGPGADIRIQTEDPKPWDYSEAYQLKLHRSYLNQVLERDFVVGMAAWNFADFGSSFRQDAMPYINQKGLVNFDRSEKDIYHYYQARLLEEPLIYIAGANYEEKFIRDKNEKIKIQVFSNAKKVTLKVNDSLEFSTEVHDALADFSLQLPEGAHVLRAETENIFHSRKIRVNYRSNLLSEIDKKELLINVGTHVNYTDPVTKEIWISDQQYQRGGFGYIAGDVYQRSADKFQGTASDIQGTENDPLFQTMREGITGYKFDVKKGNYRLSLLFAEPNFNASEENIYNLDAAEKAQKINLRSFDVKINGEAVSEDLNLARDYGRIRAVEISYKVNSENGIFVEFEANSGKSVLSGIKLEKL